MGEAKQRKAFEEYQRKIREHYGANATDREIGEWFMRGEQWRVLGPDALIIHPDGERARRPRASDRTVSATYGDCVFKAYVAPGIAPMMISDWERFLEPKPEPDKRANTHSAIIQILLEHGYVDRDGAEMLASAIVWLASTSPPGRNFSPLERNIHYEITDTGPKQRNFRLLLSA
jgi:hypothetical protein